MAREPDDNDSDNSDSGHEPKPGDGRILSPEELDIAADEHVEEIADGRYVVSSDVRTDPVTTAAGTDTTSNQDGNPTTGDNPNTDGNPTEDGNAARNRTSSPDDSVGPVDPTEQVGDERMSNGAVHDWLRMNLSDTNTRYGFDMTAKFGDSVSQQQILSNDIVSVFESLILWYTRQIDSDTPVEDVLGILLTESNVPVNYPTTSLQELVESTDLSPDDSIADLLDSVDDEG